MRDLSHKARRIALLVAVAAIALIAAPAANAKVISKSRSIAVTGTNAVQSVTAKCPRGQFTVGGGFSSAPQLIASPANEIIVFLSERAGTRGWRVSAAQAALNGSGVLTAYVYCTTQVGTVKQITKTTPLATPGRSRVSSTATCPSGTKVLAGGFEIPAPEGAASSFLTQLQKLGGRGWIVDASRDSDDAPTVGDVTSIAYCTKARSAKTKSKTTTVTTNTNLDVKPVALSKPCPKPNNVFNGGFIAPVVDQNADRGAILVTESRRKAGGWQTSGLALGPSGIALTLTSFVYCR